MDIIKALAEELNIGRHQAEAAVKLIDEGNTIPFIARYRKEATGSLNDEVLRNLDERLKYLRNLEDRKEQVISAISDQGKMTAELEKQIREAATLVAVEDLYRPYKPKRRTRAMIAREKGLESLANVILLQNLKESVEKVAEAYVSGEKGVENVQDAINGAMDILAEGISDDAKYRTYIRNITMNKGLLQSTAKDGEQKSVYETYYNYEEPVKKAAGHRILALNRGEDEKILTVKVAAPTEQILQYLEKQVITRENPYTTPVLKTVIQDSYSRLIAPSVEREIRSELTDKAQMCIRDSIGTERHESRRIDNQLRGRSGRQGDPGESRFYISLEDDLMRLFGSERLMKVFTSLGVAENEQIEHKMLSNAIEKAQEKIEFNNFGIINESF